MDRPSSSAWQPHWVFAIVACCLLFVLTVVWVWNQMSTLRVDSDQLLLEAKTALEEMRFDDAVKHANYLLRRDPNDETAHFLAARSLWGQAGKYRGEKSFEKLRAAIQHFQKIPFDGTKRSLHALERIADIQRVLHEFGRSEENYRKLLQYSPNNIDICDRLSYLLIQQHRKWESLPFLNALLRKKKINVEQLLNLGRLESVSDNRKALEELLNNNSENLICTIGLARVAFQENEYDKALALSEKVLATHPQQIEAMTIKGLALQALRDERFLKWHVELPKHVEAHPEVWYARAAWAEEHGEIKVAIRCYWESMKRWSPFASSSYRLAQALIREGLVKEGQVFLDHAHRLEVLGEVMAPLYTDRPEPARMNRVAKLTAEMGRVWESFAWHRFVLFFYPKDAKKLKSDVAVRELEQKLNQHTPLVLPERDPTRIVDLSRYPLPAWKYVDSKQTTAKATNKLQSDNHPIFVEEAAKIGIRFEYFNDDDHNSPGMQIYQELGGGIAVLDYDRDGWPDLYLSQGSKFTWPPKPHKMKHADRLFRNLGNGKFVDVTAQANLGDELFGQGVAVGDINNDGYPDLFVSNIGINRLYQNNGDGTFREITKSAGIAGFRWSSSAAIADLNGDALPDIYVVNYVQGPKPYTLRCAENRACKPAHFVAEQDRIYLNLGDGRFKDVTKQSGIVAKEGKGLGILVADFAGDGRLCMFIANDTTANYYFVNQSSGGNMAFANRGLLSGLALDFKGLSQACMGIAFGDTNGDGMFEMLVSNFYFESNTLYSQIKKNRFVDQTRAVGLRKPSFAMLGFGTQFIDGELDGHLDIVVANGHVDDFRYNNHPYKMAAQYFRNVDGRFTELTADTMGGYFQQKFLGRSLAKLDWNRDGKTDFAIMNLHSPLAVLTNRTKKTGNYLSMHFRGVESGVDAIGVTATVTAGGKSWVHQLTAGDGFLASNHRMLTFGLGDASKIDKLTVRWPSGLKQELPPPPINQEVMIIEGRKQAELVPR